MPASPSKKTGINAELNVEISACRKLLEQEESRLGLSQSIDDRDLTDGGISVSDSEKLQSSLAELRSLNSMLAAYIAEHIKRIASAIQ